MTYKILLMLLQKLLLEVRFFIINFQLLMYFITLLLQIDFRSFKKTFLCSLHQIAIKFFTHWFVLA
jgi:hypothetical protein